MFDPYSTDGLTLQDRDLLQRLNQYFDTLDSRLRRGEGWLIFNASGPRAARITQYLLLRSRDMLPRWTYLFMPWRDFALTSYLVQVELKALSEPQQELVGRAREEFDIATRVSRQTMARSVTTDLLIVSGLRPEHEHEVSYLEDTIERRYRDRLATIIITPEDPHQLADDISRNAPLGEESWKRLEARFYETNLIAI